ncbi:PQQ-binding-like beta-propeller repeat protein [Lignipirellula cremea]|uniref:Outer membrane biogenesis protein BamB n=1 Tax=Lignipirellula cremea TaxID=2528010 RepID=A0A518DNW2_9BACT|nr:PQQ-binding-like beta-propeller repeat protein [Lignipirellula cremea]QDU93521.1 outer membrane biogenesis protein BamB [Lignipirellula cremea]
MTPLLSPSPVSRWLALLLLVYPAAVAVGGEAAWPRFHGPNGTGVSASTQPLPDRIGPDENLLWKTPTAEGISSPVIGGGRLFLTTAENKDEVAVLALDAADGRVLWRHPLESTLKTSGKRLATPTPTTDGERVICFLETRGLVCLDLDGKLLWEQPFGPLVNQFNQSGSPILVGDLVILVLDHDGDSLLVALDKRTGEESWRSHRFLFGRNYSTPVTWKCEDGEFLVVAGSGMVVGHHLETGEPAWYFRGTPAVVNPTPLAAGNGRLYTHGSSPPGGARSTPFGQLLQKYDQNADKALQPSELPACFLKTFFARFDTDASGGVSPAEYGAFDELSQPYTGGLLCILPGGPADRSDENLAWSIERSMPRTPSAVFHQGVLLIANEGGILQSIDAESGKVLRSARLGARGTIYGSPALGDGKLYLGDLDGNVSVVSAVADWENLHTATLDSEIQASPAIADGRVYFRTKTAVYCFGLPAAAEKK